MLLKLFSAQRDDRKFAIDHFRARAEVTPELFQALSECRPTEDEEMGVTWKEFAIRVAESLPPEERVKGLSVEERLKGLTPTKIEAYLKQLKKTKPRKRKSS